MNKKNIILINSILAILIVIIVGTFVFNKSVKNKDENKKEKVHKTKYMHASYGFNVNNLNNIVADADYVFVAKVNRKLNTVYKYSTKVEDEWISSPYTYYSLKVLKNIKGDLFTNKNIRVLKSGGKGKNSQVNYVYENDILPLSGQTYIFAAYVQQDGSLLVSGANSTIKVASYYTKSSCFSKMSTAAKKGGNRRRTRFKININKVY